MATAQYYAGFDYMSIYDSLSKRNVILCSFPLDLNPRKPTVRFLFSFDKYSHQSLTFEDLMIII